MGGNLIKINNEDRPRGIFYTETIGHNGDHASQAPMPIVPNFKPYPYQLEKIRYVYKTHAYAASGWVLPPGISEQTKITDLITDLDEATLLDDDTNINVSEDAFIIIPGYSDIQSQLTQSNDNRFSSLSYNVMNTDDFGVAPTDAKKALKKNRLADIAIKAIRSDIFKADATNISDRKIGDGDKRRKDSYHTDAYKNLPLVAPKMDLSLYKPKPLMLPSFPFGI